MHRQSKHASFTALIQERIGRSPVPLLYSDKHKLIYAPIAKNANSFLKAIILLNNPSAYDFDPTKETALGFLSRKTYPHHFVVRNRASRFRGYTTFAVIRDPAQRIVSCFLDKFAKDKAHLEEQTIIDFCDDATKVLKMTVTPDSFTFSHFLRFVSMVPDWRRNHHYRTQAALLRNVSVDRYFDVGNMREVLLFLQTFGMTTELPEKTVAGVKKKTVYKQGLGIPKVHDVPINQLRNLTEFPTYQLFFDEKNSVLLDRVYTNPCIDKATGL